MMVCAKNYETGSTFVEVMHKRPWPHILSGHGVDVRAMYAKVLTV